MLTILWNQWRRSGTDGGGGGRGDAAVDPFALARKQDDELVEVLMVLLATEESLWQDSKTV